MQFQVLNNRFNETDGWLLICMAWLSSTNLFSSFDKVKLVEFAKFYIRKFCHTGLPVLAIINLRLTSLICIAFVSLKGIDDLSEKLVETIKHIVDQLVYCLLKLGMILFVAYPQQPSKGLFRLWRLWKIDFANDLYWKRYLEGHWW